MRTGRLIGWSVSSVVLVIAMQSAVAAAPVATPHAAPVTHTVQGVVQSISCPSPSVCYAITQEDKDTRWGITSLTGKGASAHTTLISQRRNAVAISCPTTVGCEVFGFSLVNGKPVIYSVSKSGAPGKLHPVHGSGAISLNTIACRPSRSACVLVGGLINVVNVVTVKGSKQSSHHLTLPKAEVKGVVINAVSCPTSSFCEAVGLVRTSGGNKGFVLPIHHGVAGKWATVANAAGGMTAVACPSAGHCFATAEGKKKDFIETISNGKLTHSPSVRSGIRLKGIACTAAHTCDAVGAYFAAHSSIGKGVIIAVDSGKPAKPQFSSATQGYSAIGGYKGGFLAAGAGPHFTTVIAAG